jgi:hypothetical protein
MNWIKLSGIATVTAAVALTAVPAPAYADPVPTVDEVVAVLGELTDPNKPAADKTNIVTPSLSPEEAQTLDDHLKQMDAHGERLPIDFLVTNIQPAAANLAGATVETMGPGPIYTQTAPHSFVLADQGGHWRITHDSAVQLTDAWYRNSNRRPYIPHI